MSDYPSYDSFDAFCRQEYFRPRVRSVVSDMLNNGYWHQNHMFNSIITSEVSRQMAKTREVARTEVTQQLTTMLPHQVSSQLNQQMASYLNNHHTMVGHLDTHKKEMEKKLESAASNILTSVTSDPQYHEINRRYFEAFQAKGDTAITQVLQQGVQATESIKKDTVQNTSEIDSLKQRVFQLEDKLHEEEKWEFYRNCGMLGTSIIGIAGYMKYFNLY